MASEVFQVRAQRAFHPHLSATGVAFEKDCSKCRSSPINEESLLMATRSPHGKLALRFK